MRYTRVELLIASLLVITLAAILLLHPTRAATEDCTDCWQVIASPNVGTGDNVLNGVTVVSPSYAWAAGYTISDTAQTLIERWNGSTWQVVSSPNAAASGNYLNSIVAVPNGSPPDSNGKVWAAGYYTATGSPAKTLIERWDGTAWYSATTPNRGSSNNYLNSIAASTITNVWAVGSYVSGGVNKTLVLSSTNSTTWATVNVPNGDSGNGTLNAVAVLSTTDVWAAGYYTSTNSGPNGLMLHLDANGWHTITLNISPLVIKGLSFRTPDDGWAVGYTYTPYDGAITLHWDGTNWTPSSSASLFGQLHGVSALAINEGWTAGQNDRFADAPYAATRYWNGVVWSEGLAVAPEHESVLKAIAGRTITDVWSVGYYRTTTNTLHTLVEHSNSCPNLFVDVQGNIFYPAIHQLTCHAIVNGTDNTHYNPRLAASRGQFAKIVTLAFGLSLSTPPSPTFTDVPPSYFAYLYIESGYAHGILSGFDQATCQAANATFPCYLPNRSITRAQLTKLVVSAAGYTPYTPSGGTHSFSDVLPNNVFFVAIETAHQRSIINGYPDSSFRPNNPIHRDEMAQVINNAINTP